MRLESTCRSIYFAPKQRCIAKVSFMVSIMADWTGFPRHSCFGSRLRNAVPQLRHQRPLKQSSFPPHTSRQKLRNSQRCKFAGRTGCVEATVERSRADTQTPYSGTASVASVAVRSGYFGWLLRGFHGSRVPRAAAARSRTQVQARFEAVVIGMALAGFVLISYACQFIQKFCCHGNFLKSLAACQGDGWVGGRIEPCSKFRVPTPKRLA